MCEDPKGHLMIAGNFVEVSYLLENIMGSHGMVAIAFCLLLFYKGVPLYNTSVCKVHLTFESCLSPIQVKHFRSASSTVKE